MADAVICAYRFGSIDKLADVAILMRGFIQRAYQESEELSWPPTADDMKIKSEQLLPKELIRFLNIVMDGKPEVVDSATCSLNRSGFVSCCNRWSVETSKAYSALQHHPTYAP